MNPLAIALALAFWAPYTADHKPPCADGLEITTFTAAEHPGWGGASFLNDGCRIQVLDQAADWPLRGQCALIAHEIGHAVFGLEHTDDPSSVMHQPGRAPTVCEFSERYDEMCQAHGRWLAHLTGTHNQRRPTIKRPHPRARRHFP